MLNLLHALSLVKHPRRLYRSHLSRFRVFRVLKRGLLWVYFRSPSFFLKAQLAFVTKKRTLQMIPLGQFLKARGIHTRTIKKSSIARIPGPRFSRGLIEVCAEETVQITEPSIEVAKIPSVVAMGGTELLFTKDLAIHPDLQSPERDVIPAEYLGIAKVDAKVAQITIPLTRKRRRIPRAISLLGNCTGNYAHWLTETLPKLVIVDDLEGFSDFPLLVDEWVHPNILASIDLLNKNHREIVWVSRWEAISVDTLVYVSPPSYTPPESRSYFERRIVPKPDPCFFPFSGFALQRLRVAAWTAAGVGVGTHPRDKRLHLDRPTRSVGNGRLIVNNEQVNHLIAREGFASVSPGEMSVIDQIVLFQQAKCVVAPIGAALVNLVFAPPGCQVIIMSPYYENANYYYFSNLLGILGHTVRYVVGPQVDACRGANHIAHGNYSINLGELQAALEEVAQ